MLSGLCGIGRPRSLTIMLVIGEPRTSLLRAYQTCTRWFGSKYSFWPECTEKASYQASRLRDGVRAVLFGSMAVGGNLPAHLRIAYLGSPALTEADEESLIAAEAILYRVRLSLNESR